MTAIFLGSSAHNLFVFKDELHLVVWNVGSVECIAVIPVFKMEFIQPIFREREGVCGSWYSSSSIISKNSVIQQQQQRNI